MTLTCKNCAFSSVPVQHAVFKVEWNGRLNCNSPKLVYQGPDEHDNLVYWDAEDYEANFNVGPDFGCIHFQEKQNG